MARPRKDNSEPDGRQKLEEAFWAEMKESPYSKITVAGVIRRAGLNRNTFYYHYTCLDDLAQAAMGNVIPDVFKLVLTMVIPRVRGDFQMARALIYQNGMLEQAAQEVPQAFERLRLICSPEGSLKLRYMLCDSLLNTMLGLFRLTRESLAPEDLDVLRGVLEVLTWYVGTTQLEPGENVIDHMANSVVVEAFAPISINVFRRYSPLFA